MIFIFAFAFHVTFGLEFCNFSTVGLSFRTLFLTLIGVEGFDYQSMYSKNSHMTPVLVASFSFLGFFLILTLAIAIVEQAYDKVKKKYRREKCEPTNLSAYCLAMSLWFHRVNLPSNYYHYQRKCESSEGEDLTRMSDSELPYLQKIKKLPPAT